NRAPGVLRGGNVTAVETGREPARSVDSPTTRRWSLSRRRDALLCLIAVVLAALAYYPITRNYFFAHDFLNIYHLVNDPLVEYLVTPNGGHVLLARNAIFYASWRLFGTDPTPYFWVVFVTHLVNVALAFRVLRALTANALLASFGAALWGTSPLSDGTL